MNEYEIMIKNLENRVTELEKLTVCRGPSTLTIGKWQPKGGDFFIQSNGKMCEVVGGSDTLHKEFGVERPARQQAERASIEMRRFNRLLALRDELCGDEVVDWTDRRKDKHYVYFTYDHKRWCISENVACESVTPYFTTIELAQKACDMLNSGEVEL